MRQGDPSTEAELNARFRTRISPHIRKLIAELPGEEARRLLLQFEPDARELGEVPGYSDDPLHEEDSDIHPFPDVVRKYASKILYLTTDECPVYCRYCTRKRKTLLSRGHKATDLPLIADYLSQRPEIGEVIFSGGDPLMLPQADLLSRAKFFLQLPTIHFMRFHTRAVTANPRLISDGLLNGLEVLRQQHPQKNIAFVLHVNTAAEISDAARNAIAGLRKLGVPLYAQTVLLRGVNDSAETLSELCTTLLDCGIQPYYLHQLDRVTGAAHFEVGEEEGRSIYRQLALTIPPYMLPRYVRDSKQGKYPLI